MSRLRKEKNCLNCGHAVEETFCTRCGQKNVETHVNAFHAIGEFIGDYFHADGKFIRSIVPLLFRPGLMTNEFNLGRRERFIHPFRLYIFVSIVYFSVAYIADKNSDGRSTASASNARIRIGDSGVIGIHRTDSTAVQDDSTIHVLTERAATLPRTIEAYRDSINALNESQRPDFQDDVVNRLAIKFSKAGDASSLVNATFEKFQQTLPRMLFLLLPFAALLLKLFYIRQKRYYIDHLVHTLHLHAFIFLVLMIYSLTGFVFHSTLLFILALLCMVVYFFYSMKRVYRQSRFITIIKGSLFSLIYLVCLSFIFAAGFLYIFIYN